MNLEADLAAAGFGFFASVIAEGINLVKLRSKQNHDYRMLLQGHDILQEPMLVSRSKPETFIYLITSSSATIVCYLILSVYILNKSHTIFSPNESFFSPLDTAAFLAVLSYQLGASALKTK